MRGLFAGARALAGALMMAVSVTSASADSYTFDKGHTLVSFGWERVGLSRQQGRFTDTNGAIEFNPAQPEAGSVDVTIRASSLQTGVDALDRHLRSADFFDVANHPVITFKSKTVKKTSERQGEIEGDLTMLGTTKPVKLFVTWVFTGPHPLGQINPALRDRVVTVFSAKASINRSEWGLTRAIPLVSDEIQINIEAEVLKR